MDNLKTFFDQVLTDPVFVTFLVLLLGLLLGRLKYRGFSLGVSGAFLVGFGFGWLGLHVNEWITTLGLIIFMYAIGIQGGPSFFNSFGRKGIPYLAIASTVAVSSMLMALLAGRIFHFSPDVVLGVYTGSLANSASLSILMERSNAAELVSSYGTVYPLGMIGIIVFAQLIPVLLRKDVVAEFKKRAQSREQNKPDFESRKFMVENEKVTLASLGDLDLLQKTGAHINRVRRGREIIIAEEDVRLRLGDVVLADGTQEALGVLHRELGNVTYEDMDIDPRVEVRHILVSNRALHDDDLGVLNLDEHYQVNITRIWRSGMALLPEPHLSLHLGDSILAVGRRDDLDRLVTFLGRENHRTEVGFVSLCFAVVVGVLIGKIVIPVPLLGEVILGNSGGALLMGLILGYLHRRGLRVGQMTPGARSVLKDLGLSLFLVGIGVKAGAGLTNMAPLALLDMLAASLMILACSMAAVFFVAYKVLKLDLVNSIAGLCGGFENTPALDILDHKLGSEEPAHVFATCYPLALFFTILSSQVLAMLVR